MIHPTQRARPFRLAAAFVALAGCAGDPGATVQPAAPTTTTPPGKASWRFIGSAATQHHRTSMLFSWFETTDGVAVCVARRSQGSPVLDDTCYRHVVGHSAVSALNAVHATSPLEQGGIATSWASVGLTGDDTGGHALCVFSIGTASSPGSFACNFAQLPTGLGRGAAARSRPEPGARSHTQG